MSSNSCAFTRRLGTLSAGLLVVYQYDGAYDGVQVVPGDFDDSWSLGCQRIFVYLIASLSDDIFGPIRNNALACVEYVDRM